jgi:Tfp pilus assembly protein PilE
MRRSLTEAGQSLVELVGVMAVAGLLAGIAMPQVLNATRRVALRSVAGSLIHTMLLAQAEAGAHSCNRALKFTQSGDDWSVAVYEDENGNGVRNDEIARGVDRLVVAPCDYPRNGPAAWIGFPDDPVNDPDTGKPIPAGTSPVNFNSSTLCSFSPSGDGTPGSVYITDGVNAAMVRSSGSSGAVRFYLYDRGTGRWE